jgi:hypothetical protein
MSANVALPPAVAGGQVNTMPLNFGIPLITTLWQGYVALTTTSWRGYMALSSTTAGGQVNISVASVSPLNPHFIK